MSTWEIIGLVLLGIIVLTASIRYGFFGLLLELGGALLGGSSGSGSSGDKGSSFGGGDSGGGGSSDDW